MNATTTRSVGELLEELAAVHGLSLTKDGNAMRKWDAANASMELATVLCVWVERAVVEVENTGTLSPHMRDVLAEESKRVRRRVKYARDA